VIKEEKKSLGHGLTLTVRKVTRHLPSLIDKFDLGHKLSLRERRLLKYYPPEVQILIEDAKPEIEDICNGVISTYKNYIEPALAFKCPVNLEPMDWEECQRRQSEGLFYDCPCPNPAPRPETVQSKFMLAMKRAALDRFDNHNYSILKRKYFEDKAEHLFHRNEKDPGYPDTVHIRRDFIAKLLQVIVNDHFPQYLQDLKSLPVLHGVRRLYELYSRI
jgi:hypothetical protein